MSHSDEQLMSEVKDKANDLAKLLDDFSDRLRRMRQRNREVEQEIVSFENDLDRLRRDVPGMDVERRQ